jgi:hypothetical protein
MRFLVFVLVLAGALSSAPAFAAPDNQDAIMLVIDGSNQPNGGGWTCFTTTGICARRVIYSDWRKLHAIGRNAVALFVFQFNPSGPNPFKSIFSGHDSYSWEHDPVNQAMRIGRFIPSGQGSGARRIDLYEAGRGGGNSPDESWPANMGQVALGAGFSIQDANPSQAKLDAANALTTEQVPLG